MNTAILIPVYEPDEKLIQLIDVLTCLPFPLIIVVNDGSSPQYGEIFDRIKTLPKCTVIPHETNKGKGAALKSGMLEMLHKHNNLLGCVTVDADGQHLPEDIYNVATIFEKNNQTLVLGCRDFNTPTIPATNKMGNVITRTVYTLFTCKSVTDTQTGLRAIPLGMMKSFLKLPGDHYEFEMNMLIHAAHRNLPVKEVAIQTVYIDQNQTSHFKPFLDSVRIYKEILKFSLSSLFCSAIDIGLFTVIFNVLSANSVSWALFGATSIARLVSSTTNFTLNKKIVFKSKYSTFTQASKYFLLCLVQMTFSWLILQMLTSLSNDHVVLLKIFTDVSLFFISFIVQRIFIFGRRIYHETPA